MHWNRNSGAMLLWLLISLAIINAAVHIKEGGEMIIFVGHDFSLTCEGKGMLQWKFPETENPRIEIKYSASNSILRMNNPIARDTGLYSCADAREPHSSADIYVYVSDDNHLFVSKGHDVLRITVGQDAIVPCRVTHPSIDVTLTKNAQPFPQQYNPRLGFLLKNVDLTYHGTLACEAKYKNEVDQTYFLCMVNVPSILPKPFIEGVKVLRVPQGDNIHLFCSVKIEAHQSYILNWVLPNQQAINKTGRALTQRGSVRSTQRWQPYVIDKINLTISSAHKSDEGNYSCSIKSDSQMNSDMVQVIIVGKNESYINFNMDGGSTFIEVNDGTPSVQWAVGYEAVPTPSFQWFAPDGSAIKNNAKYHISTNAMQTVLNISALVPNDAGIYVLLGKAGNKERHQHLTLVVKALPLVTLTGRHEFFIYPKSYNVKCSIQSYPFANVKWLFFNCTNYVKCDENGTIIWQEKAQQMNVTSNLTMKAISSGKLQCQACNGIGCKTESMKFFIADSAKGFNLSGPNASIEGENVILQCSVSIYNFTNNITWWWRANNKSSSQEILFRKGVYSVETTTRFSIESKLHLCNISPKEHNGQYFCKPKRLTPVESTVPSKFIDLVIAGRKAPSFKSQKEDSYIRYMGNQAKLDCTFQGIPEPDIYWFKDGRNLNIERNNSRIHFSDGKQKIIITHSLIEDTGSYECIINNSAGTNQRSFDLKVTQLKAQPPSNTNGTVAAIAVVFILLLAAVAYLVRRIMQERKRVQALTVQDVTAFHEGALLTIDPDLGIDEQADLLPYNKDFEFPREKLKLGKQLGTGAFGRVVKAEAEGLKEEEKFTTVAVKMVKPHSDVSHLKALMTELKILIYIGHHLNVLNLLGACTTNLIQKELFVIVEYCRFGNLHSYLQRHRDSFINQVNPVTDVIDFTVAKEDYLRPTVEEISLNPSGDANKESKVVFDNSSSQLQYLDMTGENSMSTMADSSGSNSLPDQRWNITYKSDFKGKLACPLNTKDLLCWSYQVALGMEYLSSLKIVHADLAARNILLADNNIVKICDFGLARNLYKNMDYKKRGKDPLPIKWMAIESIEDRIFSTKSDVWSFGVVLWEFFTLAKSPYPGMEVNEAFLERLIQGYRMTKPEFSTHDMYRVMLGCWKAKPTDRPSFIDLVHRIGETLDQELKEHYVQLNTPYINQNAMIKNTSNNYINITDGNNLDYIAPEFPEQVYVNMCPVGAKEKIEKNSDQDCDKAAFSEDSNYLPMSK